MLKIKLRNKKKRKNISIGIFLIIIIFTVSISLINRSVNFVDLNNTQRSIDNRDTPKISAFWASINITNYQLNNTRHLHNDSITIKGNLKYNNGTGVNFTDVAIFVDNILYPQFNNITNLNGDFQINFRIPFSFDVFSLSGYKIQANVTDASRGNVFKENFLTIFANATSVFDITNRENILKIPGEDFRIEGFLRFDNINGNGIPDAQINYNWYNSTDKWPTGSFFTNSFNGFFSMDLQIPFDAYLPKIHLNLSYSGEFQGLERIIGNSGIVIPNVILFSDIIFVWNMVSKASEGENITITGEIFSRNNSTLKIYNRTLVIRYDGTQIDTTETDANGVFTYTYTIPSGIGNKSIQVDLVNTAGIQLRSINYINITAGAAYNPSGPGGLPPFLVFSLIFFPILAVIIGVLAVLGYRFYKKQEKESRVVNIPLESKLINLKILKDSGRLEESISYLFNAIYMDLINAKYGRVRKENETIRDFAIISVKELRLTPAAVYPFIQRVEAIIYAKPFKITENDFYNTCELFSPIYFQLTGFNFTLNF